ncbi:MAG: hypothetical protein ACOYNN_00265 [Terrimicrobiaceae bacterium]
MANSNFASSGALSILPCRTNSERMRFERVAEVLHGNDPAFVPPFPGSIAKYLSEKSAFHKRHGEIHPFLAVRDGRAVGRIAAIINRSHNEYHKDRVGFFGFFECENDLRTAQALFQAAEAVLREAGMESVRGPYNPSINDECGLLLDYFEIPPCIGLTWNPAYYRGLIERRGFVLVRTLHGLNLPMHRLERPERLGRITKRLETRSKLRLRPMDLKRLPEELGIVREVYNQTLERNWGFVPISMDDLLAAADDIRAIADPRLLLIAEADGEMAGVALTLPNFNEILARTKRTPYFLRLPHIFWLMKTQRIRSCRQTVLGVVPAFRDRGIHAWLVYEQFAKAQQHHDDAILGWIEESNTEVLEFVRIVGAEPRQKWGLFEKKIPAALGPGELALEF